MGPEPFSKDLWQAAGGSEGGLGTGGMVTKLQAADLARHGGTMVVIARGSEPDVLLHLASGMESGTRLLPVINKLEGRKRYIISGSHGGRTGELIVDTGAAHALAHGGSLLPVGLTQVIGNFERGDTLRIAGPDGQIIASGLVSYASADLIQLCGKQSTEIESILGYSFGDEVIIWKSPTSYSPLVVNSISAFSISFTTAIGSDFSAFYILPLLKGRFNKAMNFTKGAGGRKRAGFTFDVLNFILPVPYAGYKVDKILQNPEFSTSTKQDRDIVKAELGIYENLPTSDLIKESWKGDFNFSTPMNLIDFLILLNILKGRANSFIFPYTYLSPTGTSEAVLSSDSVTIEHSHPHRSHTSLDLETLFIIGV